MNAKHILIDVKDITIGTDLMAHINLQRYIRIVNDLLEWLIPKKTMRKRKAKAKKNRPMLTF